MVVDTSMDFILFKFLDELEDARSFRKGHMLLNSAFHFKCEIEHKDSVYLYDGRWDVFDNAQYVLNPVKSVDPLSFLKDEDGNNFPFKKLWISEHVNSISPITISNNDLDKRTKLLCLYSLFYENLKPGKMADTIQQKIDENVKFFVLITDTHEFLKRIRNVFAKLDNEQKLYKAGYGFAQYIDEFMLNGAHGVFHKPQGLGYQSEFRIFILSRFLENPMRFDMEDLSDISYIGRVDDLLESTIRSDKGFTINYIN